MSDIVGSSGLDCLEEFYVFTPKQRKFLSSFSNSCDLELAAKDAGLSMSTVSSYINGKTSKSIALRKELSLMQDAFMVKMRMNSTQAAAKFMEVFGKMEARFDDDGSDEKVRASYASPLAKMSDSLLKASGNFDRFAEKSGGVSVTINMDLTSNSERVARDDMGKVIEVIDE